MTFIVRPKQNNTLVSGNLGDKKNLHPGDSNKKKKNQFKGIFKVKFNSTFLCWKTKSPIFYFLKGTKT